MKRYGRRPALDGASFAVPTGCVYGLLGPNGAGKTTMFSVIGGFVRLDAGRVRVLDTDAADVSSLRGRIGILPQDAQFQADVPIADQLAFLGELCGRGRSEARRQAEVALALVGLAGEALASARALSHGMHKRLGIAQALLGDPELVLLDEPTAGLDQANARIVRDLVRSLRGRGATVMVSSHDLHEMQALCDEVCILRAGRVVSTGPVDRLAVRGLRSTIALSRELDAAQLAACMSSPGVVAMRATAGRATYDLELRVDADDPDGDRALAGLLGILLAADIVPRELGRGDRLERHFAEVTSPQQDPTPG